MPGFDVVRRSPLSALEAWKRVTDWRRHGDYAPLTSVTVERDQDSGRERFIARTAVGRVGFDDPMEITYSRPPTDEEPGVVRIVKSGRVVLGWAVLTVTPLDSGCEVRWHEEARLRGTGGPVGAAVNWGVALGFRRLLTGLLEGP